MRSMLKNAWAVLVVVSMLAGGPIFAAAINVDVSDLYGTYSGQAAYPDPGNNTWNLITASNVATNPASGLLNSGGSPTAVSVAFSAFTGGGSGDFGPSPFSALPGWAGVFGPIDSSSAGGEPYSALADDGVINGASSGSVYGGQLAFYGLTVGGLYDLYLYTPLDQNGSVFGTMFDVEGIQKSAFVRQPAGQFVESTWDGLSGQFGNYVLYSDVAATDGGSLGGLIVVNFRNRNEGGSGFWSVAGAQLVSVPEPSGFTLGTALLMGTAVAWRTARGRPRAAAQRRQGRRLAV